MNTRYLSAGTPKPSDGSIYHRVSLWHEGKVITRTIADWFRDFRVDGLVEVLAYEIVFEYPDYGSLRQKVQTDVAGKCIGVVALQAPMQGREKAVAQASF